MFVGNFSQTTVKFIKLTAWHKKLYIFKTLFLYKIKVNKVNQFILLFPQ